MSIVLNGTTGITTPTYGGAVTAEYIAPVTSFKNRIINGAMQIDQRNAGASVTPANTAYTLDRWQARLTASAKFSVQQNAGSVSPPAGFTNYLGVTSLSAYSVSSTDFFSVAQTIEGFNIADCGWGTANAVPVTLSFWVRSSLTGSFGGAIYTVSGIPSYPFSYNISSANTWEYKTLVIPAQTAGTWSTTNGIGLTVNISLGAGASVSGTANTWDTGTLFRSSTGATSVVGTNGATFYITGVQLEKGSTATSFDYRPYGQELALCQRYYYKLQSEAVSNRLGVGFCSSTTALEGLTFFPVTMRTRPTALETTGTAADYTAIVAAGAVNATSVTIGATNSYCAGTIIGVASGLTGGQGGMIRASNTNAFLAWSAEL
jgi:hypothetical protein